MELSLFILKALDAFLALETSVDWDKLLISAKFLYKSFL